jgi:hypothetical protein
MMLENSGFFYAYTFFSSIFQLSNDTDFIKISIRRSVFFSMNKKEKEAIILSETTSLKSNQQLSKNYRYGNIFKTASTPG